MRDYSAMSDFEINKAVAIMERPEIRGWDCHDISGRACFVINSNTSKRVQFGFSFTSDPADSWPIIQENKITILWIEKTSIWCAAIGGLVEHDHWGWEECPEMYSENINPLRAAMIVYLQMMEQKK